jgi:uncharacterized tellurite resistance protein B-like protein
MFDRFLSFLQGLPAADGGSDRLSTEDPRVAATALMVHVIDADGERTESEKTRLNELLENTYNVEGANLSALLAAAEKAEREAIDLYAFTSVLKRNLDEESRLNLVEILWEMVFADGVLHELEDNVVWRVAELIGVGQRERVELRRRVEAKSTGRTEGAGET